jgi:hypothetical protein
MHLCAQGAVCMLQVQHHWNTAATCRSKPQFIYSVEAQHNTELSNI